MNPIYRFQLTTAEDPHQVYPIYKEDLAIDYALETGEQFYRGKLSGKLTFQGADYQYIQDKAFDTQFDLTIFISRNNGASWSRYWVGYFWKTDCVIDEDAKTIVVTPTVNDDYAAVLAGMDKEFDLLTLAPTIQAVKMKKRPCLQIYIPGMGSVGQIMFGNNTYWETECESKTIGEITAMHFGSVNDQYPIQLGFYNTYPPTEEIQLFSTTPVSSSANINYGTFTLKITQNDIPGGGVDYTILLTRISDGAQWKADEEAIYAVATLEAVPDTGADYQYVDYISLQSVNVFGRIILDNENISGAFDIDADDMVANNRNYHYCIPFPSTNNDLVVLSGNKTTTPTPYGLYQPGIYYDVPNTSGHWVPIARNAWAQYSIWLNMDEFATLSTWDTTYSKDFTLKDAFPIWSVISVLLGQIAPGITHSDTTTYSVFLYGTNPISGIYQRLFITPKSNVITSGYDVPAQKAPITLKQVLEMLQKCFCCYWFIDSQKRFRIEHIKYFNLGGRYTGTPNVGINLLNRTVSRNGKSWAFARNQYEFDKPEMAARYQFGWMDDVTKPFAGYPIDIISKYVNPDNIEQIQVANFSSDVDYILLNPSAISEDGFVLLSATYTGGQYVLPIITMTIDGASNKLQNGNVSFAYLELVYYGYDMPAKLYRFDNIQYTAQGIKKLKKQTINFPVLTEPNFNNLIKTGLGNGKVQKMSVNLSSRNANTTLMYDTE